MSGFRHQNGRSLGTTRFGVFFLSLANFCVATRHGECLQKLGIVAGRKYVCPQYPVPDAVVGE